MPAPQDPSAVAIPVLECTVDVTREPVMSCVEPEPAESRLALAANRMIGGQDMYVRLSNSNNSYDAGTQIFSTSVTVQNLLAAPLGTVDGVTPNGIMVFFQDGPTSVGAGTASVANPTGTAMFTGPDQAYFLFPQILQPYEISNAQTWQFATSTGKFTFKVAVSAPQTPANELLPLLDRVWQGTANSSWTDVLNWNGALPIATSTVAVPRATLMAGPNMPSLAADESVGYLHVGLGSTLDLNGHTLTSMLALDAPGAVTDGTVVLAGTGGVLRGTLPSVRVTGSARLQGATRTSGAVSINGGSLVVSASNPLSISIP